MFSEGHQGKGPKLRPSCVYMEGFILNLDYLGGSPPNTEDAQMLIHVF